MATNLTDLRGLRDRLASMTQQPFQTRLAQLCAAAAMKLVADEFRGSHDPYGTAWLPLASRKGQPLLDTGRLRASFSTQPTSDGFRIGTRVSYAAYHQYGTSGSRRKDRLQWSKHGRFISREKAGRLNKLGRTKGVRLTFLPGGANGGIPARPMLPTESGGIPRRWTEVFQKEIAAATRRQAGGAA